MDVGQRRCPGRRSRPYPQLFAALPATVLVDELAPLRRGKAAVRVPVLAQALPLLGRHGAELLPAPLEHPLSLLGELLVALVVLPRAPLLLGGERLPGPPVPLLGAHGRRREREENDGEGDPASHPFAGGSLTAGAPEIRPVRSTMPIATTSTAAVASANAGSGSQSLQRRAGARSA